MEKIRVAITGASGFVGQGVVPALAGAGHPVAALSRAPAPAGLDAGVIWHQVPAYDDIPALTAALDGAGLVIHLADNPDRVQGRGAEAGVAILRALLDAMAAAGTGRLVVTSSVYARIAPDPGSYGHAKTAIEAALAAAKGPARVVLRLPPVYGPGGRGGFATLAKLAARGLPLPFGLATAPRAYLARVNLAHLMVALAGADDAAWDRADGQVFEPSDGAPVATADLTRMLARAQGRGARLIPVPTGLLRMVGKLTGKAEMVSGAIDALEVAGNAPLGDIFGWHPVQTMPESLDFLGA